MKAKQIFKDKYIYTDGAIREMIIWKLPEKSNERRHGLKYRLYYGYPDNCLVRYDNEQGKGDHRHYRDKEEKYRFISVKRLVADFRSDIEKLRGDQNG